MFTTISNNIKNPEIVLAIPGFLIVEEKVY
jgi:hypothetical protein